MIIAQKKPDRVDHPSEEMKFEKDNEGGCMYYVFQRYKSHSNLLTGGCLVKKQMPWTAELPALSKRDHCAPSFMAQDNRSEHRYKDESSSSSLLRQNACKSAYKSPYMTLSYYQCKS